ncbi:MAG: TIGR00730 family Rossman fold protein [Bacteroidia bacterium]|nr:TIGR00730 family Rossman fold protein [Bacteroidales bacterium]NCD40958.1 TIGR00730 family Rossman fold protein [Bacteroidia bacterium]MDD2323927.1 TIGR00730 family Rossman fold protein [Bacteroidales bacterium]MDD3011457.1 TIGR00730 family Rossman fold protein [Bacteroidales bacterium]MDD3961231.1 TIGR00730 family Rossman fold protein [Bacteroidales bacterium]
MKSICVFCGSSMGNHPDYRQEAARLGKTIGESGNRLVFGGSNIGLMTVLADAVMAHGGEVYGIMPHNLVSREIAHQHLTRFFTVSSMAERKQLMGHLSDAFVALPGGFGTLDELAEVLTWLQLDLMQKPVAILNTHGFFDHLLKWLDHSCSEGFLRKEHRSNIIVANSPEQLMDTLFSFTPMPVDHKWVDSLRKDSGHAI